MKAYLVVTGIVFAIIFALHIWEVVDRQHVFASDIVVLAASAGLSVWAGRLVRKDTGRGVP
jgi:hypothetical protein